MNKWYISSDLGIILISHKGLPTQDIPKINVNPPRRDRPAYDWPEYQHMPLVKTTFRFRVNDIWMNIKKIDSKRHSYTTQLKLRVTSKNSQSLWRSSIENLCCVAHNINSNLLERKHFLKRPLKIVMVTILFFGGGTEIK